MQHIPYPGPRAFVTGETLYGRERETLALLDLLIAERIVLLYAPSGAGKTSLIQAALVPRLQQEGYNVLPSIRVKFDHTLATATTQTNRYLSSALLALQQGPAPMGRNARADYLRLPFGEYLDRLLREDPTSQVLIFDQFEEILTIDPTNLDAKEEFFVSVGEALRNRDRWALFAMREDCIAGLDPYMRHVPTRLNTTYRLDLLKSQAASEAIREPAHTAGVDFTAAAAEKLVNDLRWTQVQRADGTMEPQLGPYVEPVQLQVVCLRLWDQLPDGAKQIQASDIVGVGSVNEALAAYYTASVSAAANSTGEQERTIREWVGRQLITEQGVRSQVLMEQGRSRGLANSTIRLLEDAHLVRADERRGITWFELSHDRLIEPIRTDNATWFRQNLSMLQLQADLWNTHDRQTGLLLQGESLIEAEEWAKLHTAELTNDETEFREACLAARADAERNERSQRRILWLAVCTSVLAVAALIATMYSVWQSQIVELQRETASARQLAAQSMATVDSDVDTGLLLAVEAYRSQPQPLEDVRSSLLYGSPVLFGFTACVSTQPY